MLTVRRSKLVYRMAVGRRIEGINVLGTEVMAPRGLLGLGQDTLSASKSEVKQVFTILANPESYPIMFHCTQGKDRTGLVAILLLLLCGVDPSVIEADYRASERELQSQRAERVRQMKNIGLGEEFASCPAGFVDGIVQYLNDGWGGCEGYLQSVGVHERMREAVKQQIMVQA
jgi:protein-tyrosine phosphatase